MDMQQNRMNEGLDKSSYAQNSLIQAHSITKTFWVIKDALEGLYSSMTPKCMMVAELGCASGPNTLMLIPELLVRTYEKFKEIPQIQVFLNDLYFNDFNSVSRSLPAFARIVDEMVQHGEIAPLFISMTPGSYRKRLFPNNFLHFVHCANSAHWLSEVPKDLVNKDGESLTKGYVYLRETSSPKVIRAYQEQFAMDFYSLLECRAQEMVQGGRMVINMMVSSKLRGPEHMWVFKFTNMVLRDMLLEGMVDEEKVDKFNIPFYPPTMEEVKKVIQREGSFILNKHETFTLDWDMSKNERNMYTELKRAFFVANTAKVATEYMISTQFGEAITKEFYRRFTEYVYQQLANGKKIQTFHQIISLESK